MPIFCRFKALLLPLPVPKKAETLQSGRHFLLSSSPTRCREFLKRRVGGQAMTSSGCIFQAITVRGRDESVRVFFFFRRNLFQQKWKASFAIVCHDNEALAAGRKIGDSSQDRIVFNSFPCFTRSTLYNDRAHQALSLL